MADRSEVEFLTSTLTRQQLLRRTGAAGFALAVPSLLLACGGDDDAATGTGSSETGAEEIDLLTWALSSPPRSLDVPHSYDLATPTILFNALESLLVFDTDLQLRPQLATEWSQPDPVTYVYTLRDGVMFWNGNPLTAEDVVYSLTRHMEPDVASELASYFASVKEIAATSATEVTVTLKEPDALFQYVPAFLSGLVVEKRFWEEHQDDIGSPGTLTMGTGPYEVTEYVPDESVRLVRNESYWGTKPKAREVSIRVITEPETRLLAMRSGEIDGAFEVPVQQYDQWDELEGTQTLSAPSLQSQFFAFDVEAEPWSDIHVRRAFAHALDREGLVGALLGGHGQAAASIVPVPGWGSLMGTEEVDQLYSELPAYPFDMDLAKSELAQSSTPGGFTASFEYPDAFPEIGRAALSLSQNVSELGVTLNVEEKPFNAWLAANRQHEDLGLSAGIWFMDYPDPANILYIWCHSQFAVKNAFNTANYKNPTVDRLLDEQQVSQDNAERAEALSEVLRIIGDDLPYLPLWFPDIAAAVSNDFVYEGFNALYIYQPWTQNIAASA